MVAKPSMNSMATQRNFVALLSLLILSPSYSIAQPISPKSKKQKNTLRVEITGFRNNNGIAACSIYRTEEGFPNESDRATQRAKGAIQSQSATCNFHDLKPGTYAVAVMHDANRDGKLNTNWMGIPTEGFGFSNDAKATIGAPDFKEAQFSYSGGLKSTQVRLQHF